MELHKYIIIMAACRSSHLAVILFLTSNGFHAILSVTMYDTWFIFYRQAALENFRWLWRERL